MKSLYSFCRRPWSRASCCVLACICWVSQDVMTDVSPPMVAPAKAARAVIADAFIRQSLDSRSPKRSRHRSRRQRDRRSVFDAVEVRSALLKERRHRLLGVSRLKSRAELLVFDLHRLLNLFARGSLHESLAGLKCAGGLLRELLRCFSRRGQQLLVRHDLRHKSKLQGPCGIERQSQQNQLGRPDIPETRRKRAGRSEFRHQPEIDEGHLELRILAGVHEVA